MSGDRMDSDGSVDERLDALEQAVSELRHDVAVASNRDVPLLKGTVRTMTGEDIDEIDEFPSAARRFTDRFDEVNQRLREAEERLQALGDIATEPTSKAEKYAAVLSFALNKGGPDGKVSLSPREIKGCTGVSRRYAYGLIEAMAEEIDGVHLREAQQVPTANGQKRKGKALLVDCASLCESDSL